MTSDEKYGSIKKLHAQRKAAGLCYRCGEPTENIGKPCNKCREKICEYSREKKKMCASAGICVTCGMKEAAKGRKSCPDCLERFKTISSAKYYADRESRLAKAKERRQRYIDAGLCYVCRQPTDRGHGKMCSICLEKTNARNRSKTKRKRKDKYVTDSYCKPSFEII